MKKLLLILLLIIPFFSYPQADVTQNEYFNVVRKLGEKPIQFVNNILDNYDLIIFDDALHSAYEPFQFYQDLIRNKEFQIKSKYIFIEVFGINNQQEINKFLNDPVKDSTTLLKVFQDDFSGYGWRYQTYLDLLSTVWEVNKDLPDSLKLKVICVDQPIYWEGIHTREDYDIFLKSLEARDYFMYKIISGTLKDFNGQGKGIFLTNTRHSYKNIKRKNGKEYWNCGTFFYNWNPGKTYSIRIHNVILSINKRINSGKNQSAEGLEDIDYSWVRMENGLWDKAFELNGNIPVAFPLKGNIFGNAKYIGNHMMDVQEGQKMYDAYDAILFLAPLDNLYLSAHMNFFYTKKYTEELKRRIIILNNNNVDEVLKKNKVKTIDEYINNIIQYKTKTKNNYSH